MNNYLTIAQETGGRLLPAETFAAQYYELRKNEGRIYTDEVLKQLPHADPLHMYYEEWLVRKNSCQRLLKWLKQKQTALSILEIGCGNGWLTAQLAGLHNSLVTGADINAAELEQAARVFGQMPNINFVYGDLYEEYFDDKAYDVIVFAAAVQYFPSLQQLLKKALQHTTLQGEIHIMDSHLYKPEEVTGAAERSSSYFTSMGFPEMAGCYFHHSIDDLRHFGHRILYDPTHWLNKFSSNKNPFFHVMINNDFQ